MSKPICAIVGAGEVLGRSLAAKFADEGSDIGLISRSEEGSRAAIDAVVTARVNTKTRHFPADATQPSSIEQAMGSLADPDAVAESYWLVHCQPRSAWSNEVELRPHMENWTC